ncbi:MAG: YggS family pyridoxal phosphate enzyme [Actinomycetota bacterium]
MSTTETPLPTVADVRARAEAVRHRIAEAGGDPERVRLIAVTKAFPPELVPVALGAGLRDLGENYGQELTAKAEWLTAAEATAGVDDGGPQRAAAEEAAQVGPRWHFIGGLQRNKIKHLAPHVHLWHSIDRSALVAEVAKRAPGAAILIQVNTTGEDAKSGCDPAEAPELVAQGRELGLDVQGLMTVGPTDTAIDPRPSFTRLAELARGLEVPELSMGMSGDLETAVAEGATMIRVGTSLFGPRQRGRLGENHRRGPAA